MDSTVLEKAQLYFILEHNYKGFKFYLPMLFSVFILPWNLSFIF